MEFVVVLGFGLLATTAGGYPGDAGDFVVAWSLAGIGLLCTLFMVTHPRLVIAESGITIVKLFGVEVIGWDDISRATPGYWGLTVNRKSGGSVTAPGVLAKPNYAVWFGKKTRSDNVAAWIVRMASSDPDFRRDQFNSLAFFYL